MKSARLGSSSAAPSGGLVHVDTLVLPYGISDGAIGIATVGCPNSLPHNTCPRISEFVVLQQY
jgi:hypothetical protein